VDREELKPKIDELMRQLDVGEIDYNGYVDAMADLVTSARTDTRG